MKKNLFIIILIVILQGCSRDIECSDPPINISFISFTANTLHNIIIRKFDKDSHFQSLVDTLQVSAANGNISNRGDTSDLSLYNPNYHLKAAFDWQIFIPGINRTISITDINKLDKNGKCAAMQTNCFCDDEVLGLKVDNRAGVLTTDYGYRLFIR
jgi:hypothetical protein